MVFCTRTSARRVCYSRVRVILTIVRFWGWTENDREQAIAKEEVASGAVPGIGPSQLSEEMQGAAFRNSYFSQLNFGASSFSLIY